MTPRKSTGSVKSEDSWILESDTGADQWSEDSADEQTTQSHVFVSDRKGGKPPTPVKVASSQSTMSLEPEFQMPSMTSSYATPTKMARKRQPNAKPTPQKSTQKSSPKRHGGNHNLSQAPGVSSSGNFVLNVIWSQLFLPITQYILSTFSYSMALLRPFLGLLLALWIISSLLSYAVTSFLSITLLGPVCSIPFSSSILPICATLNAAGAGQPEFDTLMSVQGNFDQILESSMSTANLPIDMKRSESSIRDLKHVVEYSTLPSRHELVFELGGFVETARQASGDLSRFNSRIGRAVDAVISTNRWTLQVLDGINEQEASRGSLSRSFGSLVPFFGSAYLSEDLVLRQYLRHTHVIEDQIAALVVEAQTLLAILQNLDDRLDVIGSIATRDGLAAKTTRDELFANIWTWLGANRGSVKKTGEQLRLLRDVSAYQKAAFEHVSATIVSLQGVGASLEDLRERISAPDIETNSSPRAERIPLKVHIENIEMGVDRLERQRGESRRVEGEERRKIIEKGGAAHEPSERREIESH